MDTHPDNDLPVLSFEKKGTDKAKITNLAGWLRTWNAYMSVYTQYRPHMVPELLAYQDIITEFANTHPAQHWLAYDRAFRQYIANNPTASWATENRRIYNTYIRNAPVLSSVSLPVSSLSDSSVTSSTPSASQSRQQPCFNCHKFGHKAFQCNYARAAPATASNPSHTSTGGQASSSSASGPQSGNNAQVPFRAPQRPAQHTGICQEWNAGAPCLPGCRKDHRCDFCSGLHPRHR